VSTFVKAFQARWADMDFNAHMKNTAYLDICPDVRMMYFAEHGFPISEFERRRLGPVIRRDEIDYHRELRLLDPFTVDLTLAGISADGSHFLLRNEFRRGDGRVAARVTSEGGWLDLDARRLCAPPPELAALLAALEKTADFRDLESSVRGA
jgi:acyl-CoA thioester hydrolase